MIKIENLTHQYQDSGKEAVKNITLHIDKGESLVLVGPSGSGKSTLLKSINRLIEPLSGDVFIDNENILKASQREVHKIRGKIGMIFQNFNLIERENVFKNVMNGRLRYSSNLNTLLGRTSEEDCSIVQECLKTVGLEQYANKRAADLSGGEKQRVAIARALSQKPDIILADEPVSNLDPKLMKEIMDLLKNICAEKKITLVASLHFLDFAKRYGSRIIGLRDGEIVFGGKPEELTEKDIVDIYGKTKDWYLYGKTGF
ncbi:MAG: phosphonate ABC transporter ATP-binding protein [bacterium]